MSKTPSIAPRAPGFASLQTAWAGKKTALICEVIRRNPVSEKIILHHERVYIQVSQPSTGNDSGVLIRRCKGRRDYTGERNHFESLSLFDDLPALAGRVNAVLGSEVRP